MDGEKGKRGYGGGGRGRLYTYRYTVTTKMIPHLVYLLITGLCEPVWPSGKGLGW